MTTSTSDMPIMQIEHMTMRFGGLVAVSDLSFQVHGGEITALIGPNGAGKTTVFNCITGFYKPSSGRITFTHNIKDATATKDLVARVTNSGKRYIKHNDQAVFLLERMPENEVSAIAHVARTFQNIRLFTGMTVLENLIVAQHNVLMKASGLTVAGLFGLPFYLKAEREAIDLALYWLEKINLKHRADDAAGDLPYGDQRRLEIARAMCTRPRLLCLDEPAAGLNPKESLELNELLLSIRKDEGVAILLIEHDMGVVMEISDHIVVLDYGRKIADGTPENIKNDPSVIAAYLGVPDDEVEQVAAEVGVQQ